MLKSLSVSGLALFATQFAFANSQSVAWGAQCTPGPEGHMCLQDAEEWSNTVECRGVFGHVIHSYCAKAKDSVDTEGHCRFNDECDIKAYNARYTKQTCKIVNCLQKRCSCLATIKA